MNELSNKERREKYPNWWTRPMLDMPIKRRISLFVVLAGLIMIMLAFSIPPLSLKHPEYQTNLASVFIVVGVVICGGGLAAVVRFWK